MGNKNKDAIAAGDIAAASMAENEGALEDAQTAYDTDMQGLRDSNTSDFYAGLSANTIGTKNLKSQDVFDISKLGTAREFGEVKPYAANETSNFNAVGTKLSDVGYTAQGTNAGQLKRGSATGLSNVFNNLQVSTAGADMANQEADQALAASQDLAAQAGTGAGGATALAAAAAKSKQGISADIDRQVKSNEQLRAQGEQGLQRDMLAQGNLASQFNLGQSQFNVGAQNQASQFGASARNQAAQFGAGASNQFALSRFSAENQMNQFNTSQSNAERMAEFGALQNANALNASAVNSAISQNASNQNSFDMGRAGGQAQADAARYGQNVDIAGISANALNNEQERSDQDDQIIAQGQSASNKRDKWQKFWGSGKYNSKYDPNHKRYQGKAYDDSNDYKG